MTPAPQREQETWQSGQSRLRYMLGEFCLLSWRFRALLYRSHFTASPQAADEIRPRFDDLPGDIAAICMHSYPLHAPLPRIAFLPDAIRYLAKKYRQHYISLESSFDEYVANSLSSKTRKNLKRMVRRFEDVSAGRIDFRVYSTPEEMPEFHRLALSVSVKTYQHRLIQAGMPEGPEFAALLCDAAACGRAIGFMLFLGRAPVAYNYVSIKPEGIVIGERTGYDPAYSRLAPGIVLLYCAIRSLFGARRYRILDFGGGDAHYKATFSTHSAGCGDIIYFRRSFARAVAVCVHTSLTALNRSFARLLSAGVKIRLKRCLRRRGQPSRRPASIEPEPPPQTSRAGGTAGARPAA